MRSEAITGDNGALAQNHAGRMQGAIFVSNV